MPQMMPLMWSSLFIAFSITLVIFSTINFYTNPPTIKTSMTKKELNTNNWKW